MLEALDVGSRELPHGVIKQSSEVAVAFLLTVEHVLDVAFAVAQVVNDFSEVPQHQVLVREQFLVADQSTDLVLRDLLFLFQDGHGVVVFLAEENQVETGFLKVLDLEFEGALRKEVDRLGVDYVHHLEKYTADTK